MIRFLPRLARRLLRVRRFALRSEVLFWSRWLRDESAVAARLDPQRPLGEEIVEIVDKMKSDRVRILDVGAGPLTTIGQRHARKEVEIVACDVLAPAYAKLLRRRGITPVVPTIYADAERLRATFPPASFDLVVACNCVDHMERPLRAIEQMLDVVCIGGSVLLAHFVDEGKREDYTGLHAWNLREEHGALIIANEQQGIDAGAHFAGRAATTARTKGDLVVAELRRLK